MEAEAASQPKDIDLLFPYLCAKYLLYLVCSPCHSGCLSLSYELNAKVRVKSVGKTMEKATW